MHIVRGKPISTPDASDFWRIIHEYRVTIMFTAPTALRSVRRDDGEIFFLKMLGNRGGLRTLRALFLGGERSGLSIVEMYQRLLSEYCAGGAMSSIIGGLPSPISGIALSAAAGKDFNTKLRHLPSRSSQVPLGKRYRALM